MNQYLINTITVLLFFISSIQKIYKEKKKINENKWKNKSVITKKKKKEKEIHICYERERKRVGRGSREVGEERGGTKEREIER